MTCQHQFSDLYCLKCGAFQPSVLMGQKGKGKPKTLSAAGLKQRKEAAKKDRPRAKREVDPLQ